MWCRMWLDCFIQESSVLVCLHIFSPSLSSLLRFLQTLLLSSLPPFWEPSGTCGLQSQNPVYVRFISTFPVCHTLALNLPISCSPETLFCSLQTINLQSFARLRMGNCLAVVIGGGDWVVCLRNNFHPLYVRPSSLHVCSKRQVLLRSARLLQVPCTD